MFLSKQTEKKKINVNNNLGISVNWNTGDNANGITNANRREDTALIVFAQQQGSVLVDDVAIHAVSLRQLEEVFLFS